MQLAILINQDDHTGEITSQAAFQGHDTIPDGQPRQLTGPMATEAAHLLVNTEIFFETAVVPSHPPGRVGS